MEDTIQILLADDHAMVRKGIHSFLDLQPDLSVIGEAENGEEILALIESLAPDVILLDLIMPGIGGIEAARRIKATSPRTAIIILTSSQEPQHVLESMTAGASAYLLKDIGPERAGRYNPTCRAGRRGHRDTARPTAIHDSFQ
jgi:DNA-binding NarL/FixJ family response regulator